MITVFNPSNNCLKIPDKVIDDVSNILSTEQVMDVNYDASLTMGTKSSVAVGTTLPMKTISRTGNDCKAMFSINSSSYPINWNTEKDH